MADLNKVQELLLELKKELNKSHYAKDDREYTIINKLRKSLGMEVPKQESVWHERKWQGASNWQKAPPQQLQKTVDQKAADRLANTIHNKMFAAKVKRQPTDEELFGSLVKSKEELAEMDNKWNNTFNNWLDEAARPISERFSSPEEEQAYWNNLQVSDGAKQDL